MKKFLFLAALFLVVIDSHAQQNNFRGPLNPLPATRSGISSSLPAPVQIYPIEGAMFEHFRRHTVLVWEKVAEAASYSVEVDCFHCCKSGEWCTDVGRAWMVRDGISSNVFDFNFVGAQPGRWRVSAVNSDGRKGEASPWRTFKYRR